MSIWRTPQPFIHREWVAGERIRVGALVAVKPSPERKSHWKVYAHRAAGGDHQNLFVAPNGDLEYIEEGELALVVQVFGTCELDCILRHGERCHGGDYERGMTLGTPLVSAGDGTLMPASRFTSYARIAGTSVQTLDLTGEEEDQIVRIRTTTYSGSIAVAG